MLSGQARLQQARTAPEIVAVLQAHSSEISAEDLLRALRPMASAGPRFSYSYQESLLSAFVKLLVKNNLLNLAATYRSVLLQAFKENIILDSSCFREVNSPEMVKFLKELGLSMNPSYEGSGDHSALVEKIKYADEPPSLQLVQAFLDNGVKINARSNCGTALTWAMSKSNHDSRWEGVVAFLRAKQAKTADEVLADNAADLFEKEVKGMGSKKPVFEFAESKGPGSASAASPGGMSARMLLGFFEEQSAPAETASFQQVPAVVHLKTKGTLKAVMADGQPFISVLMPSQGDFYSDFDAFMKQATESEKRAALVFSTDLTGLYRDIHCLAARPKGQYVLHMFPWGVQGVKSWTSGIKEGLLSDLAALYKNLSGLRGYSASAGEIFKVNIPVRKDPVLSAAETKDDSSKKQSKQELTRLAAELKRSDLDNVQKAELQYQFSATMREYASTLPSSADKKTAYEAAVRACGAASLLGYAKGKIQELAQLLKQEYEAVKAEMAQAAGVATVAAVAKP